MKVIKKNGTHEDYNESKIIVAIRKSAKRIGYELTEDQESSICNIVYNMILEKDPFNVAPIPVNNIHNYVEKALDVVAPEVAKSYKDYRKLSGGSGRCDEKKPASRRKAQHFACASICHRR